MRCRLLLLVPLLGLAACRDGREAAAEPPASTVVLSGQLFTIRNDGVNLPLGGVVVSWVPAASLDEELERIRERAPRIEALLAYESTLREAAASLQRIRDDRRSGELLDRFVAEAGGLVRRSRSTFENHRDIDLILQSPRFARAHEYQFTGSGFEREVQSHWMLVQLFVARLDSMRDRSTETDADGRFKLELPASADGFLLADAQTTALGATHHDYWLVPAGESSRDDLVLSPRSRLGPQRFRAMLEAGASPDRSEAPRLDQLYGLPDLGALIGAMGRYDEIARNLDQREHLEQRIEVLRRELSETVPPAAN